MKREADQGDQGDLFSTTLSELSQPQVPGGAGAAELGWRPRIETSQVPMPAVLSKTAIAIREASYRRWAKREQREKDKREGITPAQRHIADALAEGRQPPLWAIQKREKELTRAAPPKSIQAISINVVSLQAICLQRSIKKELQASREARFRAISSGMNSQRNG